jgi:hypothetical protein
MFKGETPEERFQRNREGRYVRVVRNGSHHMATRSFRTLCSVQAFAHPLRTARLGDVTCSRCLRLLGFRYTWRCDGHCDREFEAVTDPRASKYFTYYSTGPCGKTNPHLMRDVEFTRITQRRLSTTP